MILFCYVLLVSFAYQVQKSVDSQFKKAIEQYRDNIDLQNAIDSVQESVSYEAMLSYSYYLPCSTSRPGWITLYVSTLIIPVNYLKNIIQ